MKRFKKKIYKLKEMSLNNDGSMEKTFNRSLIYCEFSLTFLNLIKCL